MWTERKIQQCLFNWVTKYNHQLFAPNIYYFNYETDFLSLDSKYYLHDFEIKISRSDFKADLSKPRHSLFAKLYSKVSKPGRRKHIGYNAPNCFWYVCPANLIKKSEVPPYAGLIYVYKTGGIKVIKKRRYLHKYIIDKCLISQKISVSLGYRWFKT